MDRIQALRESLRELPVERVTDALRTLDGGSGGVDPSHLSHRLSVRMHRPGVMDTLTCPQHELLKAAAEIAGPRPNRALTTSHCPSPSAPSDTGNT